MRNNSFMGDLNKVVIKYIFYIMFYSLKKLNDNKIINDNFKWDINV